jgi:hypothetical protein
VTHRAFLSYPTSHISRYDILLGQQLQNHASCIDLISVVFRILDFYDSFVSAHTLASRILQLLPSPMGAKPPATSSMADLLHTAPIDTGKYEALYKHLHQNPELSNLEAETSKTIVSLLSRLQAFDITTSIGGHGVVGVLKNGPGKTILLRADMDALPILEATGLLYSSKVTMLDVEGVMRPVMHACGHDMHMTCLLAAAEILVKLQDFWSGTLVVLFQPAEERGTGAQAMVDDGLYDKHKIPVPDFVLGQHIMAMRAGSVGSKIGTIMAGADSMKITLFGLGGHGSQASRYSALHSHSITDLCSHTGPLILLLWQPIS